MTRAYLSLSAAAVLLALTSSSFAAAGWDGTWSGAWGGKPEQATTITISGKKVVSYSYQGVSHPVASSNVTATSITYEDQGNKVVLTKTGEKTAHATLHAGSNDADAELTRQ